MRPLRLISELDRTQGRVRDLLKNADVFSIKGRRSRFRDRERALGARQIWHGDLINYRDSHAE